MGKTLTYVGFGLGAFGVAAGVAMCSGGNYTGTETPTNSTTVSTPIPGGVESPKELTPLEQSYVAPDGTLGWIELELSDDAINKVTVLDANKNLICKGFQFKKAVEEYDNDHDVKTDNVEDDRVRVTQPGIIDKFCGPNGYLFYKTPDTSNWHQGYELTSEKFLALLEKATPEIFGYLWDIETNELIPQVVWVLPELDDTAELAILDKSIVL